MNDKPTYEELEIQIAELKKQNEELLLNSTIQNEEKEKRIADLIIANNELTFQTELIKAKESEDRFKNMFERYSAIMLLIEPNNGMIIYANNAAVEFYGYSKSTLLTMNIEKINTLAPEQIKIQRQKTLDEKQNYFIFPHKLANGTERIVEVYSTPINFKEKQILFSIIHDITDSQRAEEKLRESEEKYSSMISNISDVIGIIGVDGFMKYKSPNIEKWFGWKQHDLIGTDGWLTVHPDDLERIQKEFFTLLAKEKSIKTVEYRYKCKDESYKWIELTATNLVNDPIINGVLMNYHDITDRKQAEQALKESQAKISAIFQAIPDMMFIQNIEGVYIDFFLPENAITFVPPKVFLGQKMQNVLPTDIVNEFLPLFEKAISSKEMQFFEYSVQLPDKIHFYEARTISYETNKILTIVRDITFRHTAEQVIKQQNEKLKKLNADKDRFMSILAHDLRSPFNSLLGFTDLLLKNLQKYDTKKIESQLKIIHQTTHQTYNLLEDLLLWTKSQSGKLPYEPKRIVFIELCKEIIDYFTNQSDAKGIKINSFEHKNTILNADLNMLKTILRNLISNAIKFTNKNGEINIYAEINIDNVIITISDNGVGIGENDQTKLWNFSNPFTTEGTANEKGTGLGLLLCKEFVEKHGGKIWVESDFGKGSDFKFTMPLCND